jgi:alpha-mannosidase
LCRSYFQLWWNEQNEEMKQSVRKLVQTGQLEFVNGGWVMADEATTSYVDVINQITEGHVFLKNELDTVPKIAYVLILVVNE